MKKSTAKTAGRVILWVIAVLILVALIALILRFTNNGTDEFKTFYVGQGDKIFATKDSIEIMGGSKAELDVKYTFDIVQKEPRDFSVQIVTDAEETFNYSTNDERFSYRSGVDVGEAFHLETDVGNGHFQFTAPLSMQEILSSVHGEEVTLTEEPDLSKTPYFKILVTSYDGKKVIELSLLILRPEISGVELDQSGIVFDETAAAHEIGYKVKAVRESGATDLSQRITFECRESAADGEFVKFSFNVSEGNSLVSVELFSEDRLLMYLGDEVKEYLFTMPARAVEVVFTIA